MDRKLLLFIIVGAASALILKYTISGGTSGMFPFLVGMLISILFLYKISIGDG